MVARTLINTAVVAALAAVPTAAGADAIVADHTSTAAST